MGDRFSADHVRIVTFLGGTGISLVGNLMAMVALPWFVLETTGSASQTGLTGMAAALPAFASGIFGGPLVDRFGGRRMSVIADIVSGLAILAIPSLYLTVGLAFWQLFLLVLLGALLDVPGLTARRTLLPGFARRANVRPEAINSSFEMLTAVSGIFGPAIAGLLIAPMGAVNLLWLTGAGFFISAITVYGIVPAGAPDAAERSAPMSYRQQIVEGLSFIGRDRLLLSLALVFGASNFLSNGFYGVGLPVIMHDRFEDASRFGLVLSATSVGTLVGGIIYGSVGHRFRARRRAIVMAGFMMQPLFMAPFIWDSPYVMLMLASFLSGLTMGPINPLSVTVRFERTPQALHGRVFATFSAISAVVSPLGMMTTGYLFEAIGAMASMGILTALAVVIGLTLPGIRAWREMNILEPTKTRTVS